MSADGSWTVELTHTGRKSGKEFTLEVWCVDLDGDATRWIGSRDASRAWVRNLRASGRARLDFGEGAREFRVEERTATDQQRFDRAILRARPIAGRWIRFLTRGGTPCCFRLTPAD